MSVDLPFLLRDLGLNVIAITLLAYGLYFRRHRRRDLMLNYVALNVSLFSVAAALTSAPLSIGVGFGLFAVLSIVRLRSDETTQAEIGYTMTALVVGLLAGLPGLQFEVKVLLVTVILMAMYLVDHPVLFPFERHQRFRVELDRVITDPDDLVSELHLRVVGEVKHFIIQEVDFVRETMRVDVRMKVPRRSDRGEPQAATLDVSVK